jgi:hypothetical protein
VGLLKQLGLETTDKAGYEEAVRHYTALPLIPDYYPEIIRRLKGCIQEQGDRQTGQ